MFYKNIEKNRKNLNDNEEEILSFLVEDKLRLKNQTIREVADHFYTVPNTIVRMCKKLGFTGFQQFKDEAIKASELEDAFGELTSLDDEVVRTKQILNEEVLSKVIDSIHQAEKILLCGVGLSRFPAEELSERLKIVGKQSQTFVDPHILNYSAKLMKSNDLVIAISLSGREDSTVYAATSRAKVSWAKTVSITGFSSNPLANLTDYQLYGYSSTYRINGIDAAVRFSLHYIVNLIFLNILKLIMMKNKTTSTNFLYSLFIVYCMFILILASSLYWLRLNHQALHALF